MSSYVKSLPGKGQTARGEAVPWVSIAWFGLLLIVCYAPVLARLVSQWVTDEDMGHGFFVPIVAGFIVWQRRAELAKIQPKTNYWGLAVMVWGMLQMLVGALGAELFLARTAFLISLVGVLLFLWGTRAVRELAFPLLLLLFMIPIPRIIYSQITLPLQLFASNVAAHILEWVGIPVVREGNLLELPSQTLNVVDACSGIRSLLSLSFLSLIYAYFFDKKVWMRWVLLIATVPIAIAANAGRVTIAGMMSEYRADLAEGAPHLLEGWVLFLVALVILIGFHQLVNRIYGLVSARRAVRKDGIS